MNLLRICPILDSHIHLDPYGSGIKAVQAFMVQGGTHLIVVHKPYSTVDIKDIDSYKRAFDITQRMTVKARNTGVIAWCVLGPYPGELPGLADRLGLDAAVSLQKTAMREAASLVGNGVVIGLGEIGRVHYPISEVIMSSCDEILIEGMDLCREIGCCAVLHTESPADNPSLMGHLSEMCSRVGLAPYKAVKHYSPGYLADTEKNGGLTASVLATRPNLKEALNSGEHFLMETDFIDEPSRPDVVLPPDTIPKRIRWLRNLGAMDDERQSKLMIDLPERVLGVDMSHC